MNTKQLKFLATEVMGWVFVSHGFNDLTPLGHYRTSNSNHILGSTSFVPHKDIAQAIALLEKASKDGWTLYNDGDEYDCYVGYKHQHTSHCKCEAICEAVLKSKGYKEE